MTPRITCDGCFATVTAERLADENGVRLFGYCYACGYATVRHVADIVFGRICFAVPFPPGPANTGAAGLQSAAPIFLG